MNKTQKTLIFCTSTFILLTVGTILGRLTHAPLWLMALGLLGGAVFFCVMSTLGRPCICDLFGCYVPQWSIDRWPDPHTVKCKRCGNLSKHGVPCPPDIPPPKGPDDSRKVSS